MTKAALISAIILSTIASGAFAFDFDFGVPLDPEHGSPATVKMGIDFPGCESDRASVSYGGVIEFPGGGPAAITPELAGFQAEGGHVFASSAADDRFTATWLDIKVEGSDASHALQVSLYQNGDMLMELIEQPGHDYTGAGAQNGDSGGLDPRFLYSLPFDESKINVSQWLFKFDANGQRWDDLTRSVGAIPEPATTSLIALSLLGLAPAWRRFRR
jgi:hypothetical protein